jgi:hypothetical protein
MLTFLLNPLPPTIVVVLGLILRCHLPSFINICLLDLGQIPNIFEETRKKISLVLIQEVTINWVWITIGGYLVLVSRKCICDLAASHKYRN